MLQNASVNGFLALMEKLLKTMDKNSEDETCGEFKSQHFQTDSVKPLSNESLILSTKSLFNDLISL